jgi:hypothetical protein
VTLLDHLGVDVNTIGDSTGGMEHLSGV